MYKNYFTIFSNNTIHYLDAAATTQRPQSVVQGVEEYYRTCNGNAGRGSHRLAVQSSELVEQARRKTEVFIGAEKNGCVIFTKNATESLNIIAYCYGLTFLQQGDEILVSIANHHANIVPWQYVAQKTGAVLKYTYPDMDGNFDMADFTAKLTHKTKITAVSAAVNTTGVIYPIAEIIQKSHEAGAVSVIDAAQSISHMQHNVCTLDCDFFVFSGHKLYAEFGVGVLYAKNELLNHMPPFLYGGSMIDFVSEQTGRYKDGVDKYEGGTLNTAAIHSLRLSIEFIETLGANAVHSYLNELDCFLLDTLHELPFVETYHTLAAARVPIVAFNVKTVHSHDTAYILDEQSVLVRSGHHCTQPLMQHLQVPSCCRASLGLYNTKEDILCLAIALQKVQDIFKV